MIWFVLQIPNYLIQYAAVTFTDREHKYNKGVSKFQLLRLVG